MWLKLAPKWSQGGPSSPKVVQVGLKVSQIGLKVIQIGLKVAQFGPQVAQIGLNMSKLSVQSPFADQNVDKIIQSMGTQ